LFAQLNVGAASLTSGDRGAGEIGRNHRIPGGRKNQTGRHGAADRLRGPRACGVRPATCTLLPPIGARAESARQSAFAQDRRRFAALERRRKPMQKPKGIGIAVMVGFGAVVGSGSAEAADKLKLGVTATLEGTYTVLGEDGMRGFELALKAHQNKAGGKEIEYVVGSTDASPDSAVRAAKKLVEQDKV